MRNSRTLKALKTLNTREFRRFKEYVHSPFFNKNRNVRKLIDVMDKYYPKFDSNSITEANIFNKIFPELDYDYFKLRNLLSELFKLYNSYLKIIAYEKTELEGDIDLLSELHDRKQDVPYRQIDSETEKKLSSSQIKDEYYFYLKHKLNKINTSHYKFDKSKKYEFDSIQTEFNSFLQYSITGLLQHYSKMLHNRNHGNIKYNMEMFDLVMEYIKDKDFRESPSCMIYKQIILVELSRKEEDYRKLLKLKEKFKNNISREDLYYVYLVMNSFSVGRLRMGDESYYKDRFAALKGVVDEQFFASDYILFPNFISTFTSACMIDEFKWASDFMEKHSDGISPVKEKNNTITYCKAFLAYRKREYDKALDLFAVTNFKFFLFKVMVRSYMLRIYYEKDLHEQTLNAVDAFRHYLKSEEMIDEDQKKAHYDFLKHLTTLSNMKIENNQKKNFPSIMSLEKQIQLMDNSLGIRNWLLNKTKELLNST